MTLPAFAAAAAAGLDLRPMTEDDIPFARDLYASTRAAEVARTGWPAETQLLFLHSQFGEQHRHYRAHYPGAEWLIVERAGERIGRLYLHGTAAETRIVDISVAPDSRGRGYGEALLRDVLDDARRVGRFVSIHVEKTNPAARLYERLGFAVAGEHGIYDRMEWRP